MQRDLNKLIVAKGFKIAVEDIDKFTEEDYAKIRHIGFGASDSSKLLEVNPFPNGSGEDLLREKIEEIVDTSIGEKASVRKGKDLEPFIINKIESIIKTPILKPKDMYRDPSSGLTVNFDGVMYHQGTLVPAEIKVVTKWGRRHYDWSRSENIEENFDATKFLCDPEIIPFAEIYPENFKCPNEDDIERLVMYDAQLHGIPPYYYTQIQQQMYFLGAEYGFLFVMDDDNWRIHVYKIPYNEKVVTELLDRAKKSYIKLAVAKGLEPLEGVEDYDI